MISYQTWKSSTVGRGWDMDGSGDWDCVDVPKSWAVALYGDWVHTIGYGNAKDLFANASDDFFGKITNDRNDPNQLPIQGDILVFGATPEAGYANTFQNPYGHTGVLDSCDSNGYTIISQASGTGELAEPRYNAWNFRPCIGWLRPRNITPPAAPPPAVVNPYTVEAISAKEVKLNKDTHKWGLNYDNLTAIENNPEGTISAGSIITVQAILHHNIGYNYYLQDPNVASGYNVLDCDDYTLPPVVPVKSDPPAGALRIPSTETFEVVKEVPGYLSSNQAINNINPKVTIPVGTYFVFNRREQAINLTKTPGAPGAWINPADNTFTPVSAEPEVIPEPVVEPEVEAVPEAPAFADTYRAFPQPELFVAMQPLVVSDLEGKHRQAKMPQYSITWITGSFTVDGVEYARPKSATDKSWWYGIAWIDPATNLANLELESEVFNNKTSLAERQATRTLKKTDYLLLAIERLKHFKLAFTQFLGKMKASK